MKPRLIGVIVGAALFSVATLAQETVPPVPPASVQSPLDVTLTGCLIQGSSPTVFILDNARSSTQDKTQRGTSYLLASASEDMDFAKDVNHEVTVTGTAELKTAPTPPPGGTVPEKDLPKFSAKIVTTLSDKCSAVTR